MRSCSEYQKSMLVQDVPLKWGICAGNLFQKGFTDPFSGNSVSCQSLLQCMHALDGKTSELLNS